MLTIGIWRNVKNVLSNDKNVRFFRILPSNIMTLSEIGLTITFILRVLRTTM